MSTRSRCALFLLCLVQGCERFAFFAMLPLFVLYLQQRHGFTEQGAMLLLGVFSALSYLGALPGGMLADRRLGRVGAALLGCALLTLGYGALALDWSGLLWPALGLMVAGHGFFKPSVSALVGGLFQAAAARRERGFLAVHFAINVGAAVGPLCGDWSRVHSGWVGPFLWATIGTSIASAAVGLTSRFLDDQAEQTNVGKSGPILIETERERLHSIWTLCVVAVVLYLTAQQAGTSLVLFAETHTVRSISVLGCELLLGPSPFASLHSLFVLMLLPPLSTMMHWLQKRRIKPLASAKMIWGFIFTAAAFALLMAASFRGADAGRVSPAWLMGCYALLSIAEILLAPLGLSLLVQLLPSPKGSQAAGMWFTATALGNVLSGVLGLLWGGWPVHLYFGLLVLLALGAAAMLTTFSASFDQLASRDESQ